jgi:hypothetical protein
VRDCHEWLHEIGTAEQGRFLLPEAVPHHNTLYGLKLSQAPFNLKSSCICRHAEAANTRRDLGSTSRAHPPLSNGRPIRDAIIHLVLRLFFMLCLYDDHNVTAVVASSSSLHVETRALNVMTCRTVASQHLPGLRTKMSEGGALHCCRCEISLIE